MVSNVTDPDKQQSMNILLGLHSEQTLYGIRSKINDCLGLRTGEYMNTRHVRVGCFTWNCAGKPPQVGFDLTEIVLPDPSHLRSYKPNAQLKDQLPHFYIVGLQEMVNLEVVGALLCSKDLDRMNQWEENIVYGLNSRANPAHLRPAPLYYTCILRKVMFGCYIMLFARSDNQSCFKSLKSVKNKTGTKGMTANKGSVALRFNFDDTSFMFMNCHLTSGQSKVKERCADVRQNYQSVT